MTIASATYSPEDNKLRLYPESRLSPELYQRVKAAGFSWAPRQEIFVAPMWTPERADLAIELAGSIEDEDLSLMERAEARAERFEDYSDKRQDDANRAHKAVSAIADNIPFGQPILVGHHSEKHARRDAEKIENGMRKAVRAFECSEYWTRRAAAAVSHADRKERPDVRARRIKGLEADERKMQRHFDDADTQLAKWCNVLRVLDELGEERAHPMALDVANYGALHGTWSDLRDGKTTTEDAAAENILHAQKTAAWATRWLEHIRGRLTFERAMLGESGGTIADRTGPEVGGAVRCWAFHQGWSYIQKVNKVSVTVLDNWGNGGRNFTRTIPFDKLQGVMTKAQVEEARAAGRVLEHEGRAFRLLDAAPPTPRQETEKPAADESQPKAADFKAMKETLRAGIQVVSANQLFPTPEHVARRMVALAELVPGQRILEPSAGTGAIIDELPFAAGVVAVEINFDLVHKRLVGLLPEPGQVYRGDFLEFTPDALGGPFDRVLMNPPFENGGDLRHIWHAFTNFLAPGGRIVAICANGPRQQEKLKPLASLWEELPEGTFAHTGVRTALCVISER